MKGLIKLRPGFKLAKYTLLFIALSLSLISGKCKRITVSPEEYNSTMPEITQTGAGTFGMKVNGEIWRPRGAGYDVGGGIKASFSMISTDRGNNENLTIYTDKLPTGTSDLAALSPKTTFYKGGNIYNIISGTITFYGWTIKPISFRARLHW